MHLFKKLFSAFGLVLVLTVFFLPQMALAQTKTSKEIPLQVAIPGISSPCGEKVNEGRMCVTDIGDYISKFYVYFAGIAGILATCMILFAGFTWITAAGNASRIEKAKGMMNGAFIGLVLTLTSYLILKTINPELVKLRMPPLNVIQKEVLATNFCKDMPKVSGLPVISNAETIPCGQLRGIDRATADKAGYTQDYCCGGFCNQANPINPQICAVLAGVVTDPEDKCAEGCTNAKEICEAYDVNNCNAFNTVLRSQGLTGFVCRKDNVEWGFDKCALVETFDCPENLGGIKSERVSCAISGLANNKVTKCWDLNKPKAGGLYGKSFCTDINFPGKYVDTICCAEKEKRKIDCRDECEGNEIKVDCRPYNAEGDSSNYETSVYLDHFCRDESAAQPGEVQHDCCMLLWLYNGN